MSETTANTANISQTTSTYNVEHKSVTSTVTQSTPTTVDMTTTQGTIAEPQVSFDTNNRSISTAYAESYIRPLLGKTSSDIITKNGDIYSLTNSLNNSNLLTLSFKNDFKTQAENRTSFEKSNNLFATLDNQNFKYGRLFFQGSWINTRTPIDPNTKEAIGLPEMLMA